MPVPAIVAAGLAAAGRILGAGAIRAGAANVARRVASVATSRKVVSVVGRAKQLLGGKQSAASVRKSKVQAEAAREHREARLNKLWQFDSGWNLAQRINGLAGETSTSFTHAINVTVLGGPEADLRRIWYLACAAAFGRYRNRVKGVGQANLEAVWDITGKAVTVSIAYINSGLSNQLAGLSGRLVQFAIAPLTAGPLAANSVATSITGGAISMDKLFNTTPVGNPLRAGTGRTQLDDVLFMQVGPDQVTVGGDWPDWLQKGRNARFGRTNPPSDMPVVLEACDFPDKGEVFKFGKNPFVNVVAEYPRRKGNHLEVPWGRVGPIKFNTLSPFSRRDFETSNVFTGEYPVLPDDGRIITTGEKRDPRVQPPRPVIDGKSRMSVIEAIHQALHEPCYAPEGMECSVQPLFSPGLRVYPAGQGLENNDLYLDQRFDNALFRLSRPVLDPPPAKTEPTITE